MSPFLYRCPNTGDNVQAWAADDPDDDDLNPQRRDGQTGRGRSTAPGGSELRNVPSSSPSWDTLPGNKRLVFFHRCTVPVT